jgi:hypothetical protein
MITPHEVSSAVAYSFNLPLKLDQRVDAIVVLNAVKGHLHTLPLIDQTELIFAKTPILRVTFHQPFDKIVVDLNASKFLYVLTENSPT